MIDWLLILLGAGVAIFFFTILEDWTEIGHLDDNEPEDP